MSRPRASWARHLNRPFGLADVQIRIGKPGLAAERHLFVAATGDDQLGGVGAAHGVIGPTKLAAVRCHHIQVREPGVVGDAGGFDEFFSPGYCLAIFDQYAEERRIRGDDCGGVQIAVVGGPPKRGA
ncbi:MAG TPA: hypothetical protein VME67_24160 [Mycobacterium sp.]|nr:hypothetical protein [Mycobacterium sp.]HTX97649.1 hypothetical protein [Mycobacterium sp.]